MRKLFSSIAVVLFVACCAKAQETPRAELFGGYSILHKDTGDNLQGWNVSIAGNLNRWFGLVADISGNYDSSSTRIQAVIPNFPPFSTDLHSHIRAHTFLLGPRFSYRRSSRITPFGHILFGATRVHSRIETDFDAGTTFFSGSTTNFAGAIGGGLDVTLTKSLALRVVQAEYILARSGSRNTDNARVSFGLVYRFGK